MDNSESEFWITVISYTNGGAKHLNAVPGDKIIALKQDEV